MMTDAQSKTVVFIIKLLTSLSKEIKGKQKKKNSEKGYLNLMINKPK